MSRTQQLLDLDSCYRRIKFDADTSITKDVGNAQSKIDDQSRDAQ